MNYTETFDQFASRISGTDLALYAGAGIILWILFKDKLSPVQQAILDLINKNKKDTVAIITDTVKQPSQSQVKSDDIFFKLVVSWKQTRDLAVTSGCDEAVKVADQMFPFLSPNVCSKKTTV